MMGTSLRVTVATGDYDITRPILDGTVSVQGIDHIGVSAPSPQRHWRALKNREFDIVELSLGSFSALISRDRSQFVGVPVFPHRRFRHGYLFTHRDSGVEQPADLRGRSVGLRSWQTTAGVWLRGILEEHHGLPVSEVDWRTQDGEDVDLALPSSIKLSRVPEGEQVTDACVEGRIDGLIYPELPRQLVEGDPRIRRVFADPKAVEKDYYRATGIFPIMHVVAIKAELVERHPWLPRSVMELFNRAKEAGYRRLRDPRTVSLAWLRALQEEERELLGPDPWHYGFDESNRATLDTFLGYAHRQGLTTRRLEPEELFDPGTLEAIPAYV